MKPPHRHSTSIRHPDIVFEVEHMAASNYLSSPLAGGLQSMIRFAGQSFFFLLLIPLIAELCRIDAREISQF